MARVTYIQVDQADRREFYVKCVDEDGNIVDDSFHKDSVSAEKRASRLAKHCNCDWGQNY